MSAPLLLADHLAKGCNAACARALTSLIRVLIQVCWRYLHWWTFLVVLGPLGALAGWVRLRS